MDLNSRHTDLEEMTMSCLRTRRTCWHSMVLTRWQRARVTGLRTQRRWRRLAARGPEHSLLLTALSSPRSARWTFFVSCTLHGRALTRLPVCLNCKLVKILILCLIKCLLYSHCARLLMINIVISLFRPVYWWQSHMTITHVYKTNIT